jgi:Uma2 family endonuclease
MVNIIPSPERLQDAPIAVHDLLLGHDPAAGEKIIAQGVSFEQFLTLYSKGHYEWLMGKVIDVTSNSKSHAMIVAFLIELIGLYLRFRRIGQVFATGYPQYVGETRPAREPDIVVVLNHNLNRTQTTYLDGPADFVVEVISPESIHRDRSKKFEEYEAAGVPEYFMVDPRRREAVLYKLGADGLYHPTPLDADGLLGSTVLPGFALAPDLLWAEEVLGAEELIALVRGMAGA